MGIRNTSLNLTAAWKPQSQGWGSAGERCILHQAFYNPDVAGIQQPTSILCPHVCIEQLDVNMAEVGPGVKRKYQQWRGGGAYLLKKVCRAKEN